MRAWIGRALVVLVTVMTIGVLAAAPANAAWSQAPVGALTLWNDPNGVGLLHIIPAGPAGTCYNVESADNDKTDSYWNRTVRSVSLYEHANCQGERLDGPQAQTQGQGITLSPPRTRNRTTSVFFHTDGLTHMKRGEKR